MKHMFSRIGRRLATVGLVLTLASTAHAGGRLFTVSTPSIVPDPDGYLDRKVVATSKTPIGIVAVIVSSDGTNVAEFGTGFRASPAVTGDGRYYAEETAGSRNDRARSCTATATGAHKNDVEVSLTAFDANGNPTATVEAK